MTDPPLSVLNRRELLTLGAAATLGGAISCARSTTESPGGPPPPRRGRSALRTELCDLLGIQLPVLQAPMSRIVTPEMVAEVARAGGLGFIPGVGMPPQELRRQIRRVKDLTDRPFGVNLILHPGLQAPTQPDDIPHERMAVIQGILDGFRERLGIPPGAMRAPSVPAFVDEAFDVMLAEGVPVFSVGLGRPTPQMLARCRAQGTKVLVMVATVADAVEVGALGVDALIAQGGEAGGHRSTWVKRTSPEMANIGTLALVPQVVDVVGVPVVAAGGIGDGRQLVAALALGASGVLMGTRFVATRESAAPAFYKQALVDRDSDQTTVTDAFTGLYARTLRSTFTEEYRSSGAPVIPVVQQGIVADITTASERQGTGDYYPLYAGQGVGMIADVPPAAEVVRTVMAEAERALQGLAPGASES